MATVLPAEVALHGVATRVTHHPIVLFFAEQERAAIGGKVCEVERARKIQDHALDAREIHGPNLMGIAGRKPDFASIAPREPVEPRARRHERLAFSIDTHELE